MLRAPNQIRDLVSGLMERFQDSGTSYRAKMPSAVTLGTLTSSDRAASRFKLSADLHHAGLGKWEEMDQNRRDE